MSTERNIEVGYYLQNKWKAPVCNHFDAEPNGIKLKYAQGITFDGIPFEAEQWEAEGSKNVTFVFPVVEYLDEGGEEDQEPQLKVDENIFSYHLKKESQYFTVLKQGMVVCEEMPSNQSMFNYVDYLVTSGLISYKTTLCNGSAEYTIDREGNKVFSVIICLKEDGIIQAECPLEFCPFFDNEYKRNTRIKRIK